MVLTRSGKVETWDNFCVVLTRSGRVETWDSFCDPSFRGPGGHSEPTLEIQVTGCPKTGSFGLSKFQVVSEESQRFGSNCFLWAVCSPICLVWPYEACLSPCWPLLVGCSGFRFYFSKSAILALWPASKLSFRDLSQVSKLCTTHSGFHSASACFISSCNSVLLHQHPASASALLLDRSSVVEVNWVSVQV